MRHEYQTLGKAMTEKDERPGARLGEVNANAVRLDRPVCDLRHSGALPLSLAIRLVGKRELESGLAQARTRIRER